MRHERAALTLLLLLLLAPSCGGERPPAAEQAASASEGTSRTAEPSTPAETTASSASRTTIVTIVPSGGAEPVEIAAEVADDRAERARGLMERTALAEDAGMLFVFKRERQLSFWMKNTLIPLSIAYVAADGRIVDIEDMEPLDDETKHPSAEPARYALEVNQGFFEERGIEVGDTVEIPEEYR